MFIYSIVSVMNTGGYVDELLGFYQKSCKVASVGVEILAKRWSI